MVEARLLALADSGSEGASPAAADHELRDGEILRCPAPMPVWMELLWSKSGKDQ